MNICTLDDMAVLLKLGLWRGGEVDKLGYIGVATPSSHPLPSKENGLFGTYISYDTMLESCEESCNSSGYKISLSIYEPYSGVYITYNLESATSTQNYLIGTIEDIVLTKRKAYVWSHNINKTNIYAIGRQYTLEHSSLRTGTIDKPRKSKIFR